LKEAEAEKVEAKLELKELNKEIKELNKEIKEANEKLAQAQQNQGNASLSIKSIQTQHDGYTLTTLEPVLDITTRVQEYVEQIYQARKYYHENKQALPVYITDNLLALAKNDHFIELLQSYKDHSVLTFNTQHEVKTQLATAINLHQEILPSYSEEVFPMFDLGRGESTSPLADKRFRFIHPITAMQTFAQFHHLETHFPGHLATFYPNLDDHSRIIECSALCAHFLGGFTDLPVDFHQRLPSLCRVFCAQLMKDESWCQTRPQACWSSWVGQNWALRNSSSQCCAQPYQHNGHIIQWKSICRAFA
jgi:hypothetical protein